MEPRTSHMERPDLIKRTIIPSSLPMGLRSSRQDFHGYYTQQAHMYLQIMWLGLDNPSLSSTNNKIPYWSIESIQILDPVATLEQVQLL